MTQAETQDWYPVLRLCPLFFVAFFVVLPDPSEDFGIIESLGQFLRRAGAACITDHIGQHLIIEIHSFSIVLIPYRTVRCHTKPSRNFDGIDIGAQDCHRYTADWHSPCRLS